MKSRYLLSAFIVLLAAILWLGSATDTHAYTTWTSGCTDCHSDFRDATSTKPGNFWPRDKHEVHRRDMMTNLCGTCHVTNGDDPQLDFSRGEPGLDGISCMGCHEGVGLRLHHANANVGTDNNMEVCADCHSDSAPPGEDTVPAYSGGTNVNVFDPCNADDSENWTTDGLGLDNDGDLDYDAADSDCGEAGFFEDGFESGDTSAWDATVP